jgi:zinc transport system ATP-binding protein
MVSVAPYRVGADALASAGEGSLVTCERLVVGWQKPILPPIDLSIRRGKLLAVIGRNGSGKTTWFKTLLGLRQPLGGRLIKARPDLRVAYVPQVAQLDPILPVRARELVLWGRINGWGFLKPFSSRQDREACTRALAEAEATAFADKPYAELSEGQKQRILFARMLATDAELALLDEPTAAMDPVAERDAYRRLQRLAHEKQLAVVVISHSLGVAARFADELLWLDAEGQKVRHGAPEVVLADDDFREQYGDVHVTHAHEAR